MSVSNISLAHLEEPYKLTEKEGRNASIHDVELIRSDSPFHFKTFKVHFRTPYAKDKIEDLTFEVEAMSVEAALQSIALFSKAASGLSEEEFKQKVVPGKNFDIVIRPEGGELRGEITSFDAVSLEDNERMNLRLILSNLTDFDNFSYVRTMSYHISKIARSFEESEPQARKLIAQRPELENKQASNRVEEKKRVRQLEKTAHLKRLLDVNKTGDKVEKIKRYMRFIEQNEELRAEIKKFESRFQQIQIAPGSPELKKLQEEWQSMADTREWPIDGEKKTLSEIQREIDKAIKDVRAIEEEIINFEVFEPGIVDKAIVSATKFPSWMMSKFKKSEAKPS